MEAMKIKPVLVAVAVVVGTPIATRTTSVTTEIGVVLILGKMSRGQQRRRGQQRWVCSHGLKGGLVQKLMG